MFSFIRLEAYHRNSDFTANIDLDRNGGDWQMILPDSNNFNDVTPAPHLLNVTEETILSFLWPFGEGLGASARELYSGR